MPAPTQKKEVKGGLTLAQEIGELSDAFLISARQCRRAVEAHNHELAEAKLAALHDIELRLSIKLQQL